MAMPPVQCITPHRHAAPSERADSQGCGERDAPTGLTARGGREPGARAVKHLHRWSGCRHVPPLTRPVPAAHDRSRLSQIRARFIRQQSQRGTGQLDREGATMSITPSYTDRRSRSGLTTPRDCQAPLRQRLSGIVGGPGASVPSEQRDLDQVVDIHSGVVRASGRTTAARQRSGMAVAMPRGHGPERSARPGAPILLAWAGPPSPCEPCRLASLAGEAQWRRSESSRQPLDACTRSRA